LLVAVIAALAPNCHTHGASPVDPSAPRVLDDRFTISPFAEHPQIVTPVGATIDARGRLLVLENHTHFPPKGYSLHQGDRIRRYEDSDGDGRADRIETFYDGLHHALHLTTDRDGTILVATRSALYRLHDADRDGRAERSQTLLRLETKCDYPHNGLFSAAVDYNGDLVVSMGENLGEPYRLIGSDGKFLTGGGEGGNIFRCRADGSGVEKIATGFWNPVQLRFDPFGRLLTIDNDPDSRPPCRLLHIVDGGDYGYRYRNGRKGLHPFTAWNGDLPGTLPMMSGTAEAPSGLLLCEAGFFPDDYRGTMLVTSWGDHRIEWFRPVQRGASFGAEVKPLVVGGENFRPVAIEAAPDNSIYVTDWVDKSYELHGKGRIWRICVKSPQPQTSDSAGENPAARAIYSRDERTRTEAAARLASTETGRKSLLQIATGGADSRVRAAAIQALAAARAVDDDAVEWLFGDGSIDVLQLSVRVAPRRAIDYADFARRQQSPEVRAAAIRQIDLSEVAAIPQVVLDAVGSDDPFLRTAAIELLRRTPKRLADVEITKLATPRQQVGVLLAQRAAGVEAAKDHFRELMKSADPDLLFVIVEWIGEARLAEFRADLESLLARSDVTSAIAASAMAALSLLDGQRPDQADQIGSHFYMARLLVAPNSPPAIKARALRGMPSSHESLTGDRLRDFLVADDARLRLEAVRTLRETSLADRAAMLLEVAGDTKQNAHLRADAIMGLSCDDPPQRDLLWKLATGDSSQRESDVIRVEAIRTLRGAALNDDQRKTLKNLAEGNDEIAEQARRVFAAQPTPSQIPNPKSNIERPDLSDIDGWLKLLAGPADAAAGERAFYHSKSAGCYRCHRVDGRGADVGPDLTLIGRTLDRRRIVESILQPAKDIAPQFFAWQIRTGDGLTLTGMLVEEHVNGDQTYVDAEGKRTTFSLRDVAERRAMRTSIMPDRLVDTLTVQEFRDLVAFLSR
jgi:putative membrane-bound dehydrogenase-like protein